MLQLSWKLQYQTFFRQLSSTEVFYFINYKFEYQQNRTMTEEKLYSQDKDGNYTLNFPNRKALSIKQIEDKFSQYGTVLSVKTAGDERGFRFVRFATIEEAIAAVEGLQNDPNIKLVVRKPKQNRDNWTDNQNRNYQNRNNDRRGHDQSRNQRYNQNQQHSEINSPEPSVHSNPRDSPQVTRSPASNDLVEKSLQKLNVMRGVISDTFGLQDGAASLLLQDTATVPEAEPEMPALKPAMNVPQKVEVFPAQEVIVANVHDNYGPAFILHLLEKYDPISITKFEVVKKVNLRYCHVYFKTVNDAEAVIDDFDNYNLMGKRLVVVKPH